MALHAGRVNINLDALLGHLNGRATTHLKEEAHPTLKVVRRDEDPIPTETPVANDTPGDCPCGNNCEKGQRPQTS